MNSKVPVQSGHQVPFQTNQKNSKRYHDGIKIFLLYFFEL